MIRAVQRGLRGTLRPAASVAVALVVWEFVARVGIISSDHFPLMTEMVAELGRQVTTSEFWALIEATLSGWLIGLVVAAGVGIPLGMAIGSNRHLYRATRGTIEFFRPIPSVALVPVAVLIYGTGMQSKVFLVVFASVWPILIQSLYGVQAVDPIAKDTARSFRCTRWQLFSRVVLPGTAPYIATGLRIASAFALILAVTAELVIGSPGIGQAIFTAHASGAITLMYALIVASGMVGWALNAGFVGVERRVLKWHPSHRRTA